jgi:transcriptional accessory protein Tex/SPT6
MKTEHKSKLIAIVGMPEIPFVSAGISSETDGFVVSEDGLTRIAEALVAGEEAAAQVTNQTLLVQQANEARESAEGALATANETIAANATRIEQLEARVSELENEGGITATSRQEDATGKKKVKFHESAENPMNKIADSLLGAPVPKTT